MSNPSGFEIVAFVPSEWLVVHSLAENTMLSLAKRGGRVLIVEPLYSMSSFIRVARWQNRSIGSGYGLRQESENIWIYTPPPVGIPGQSRSAVAARASAAILARLVTGAIGKLGFDRPVLWSFMYNLGGLFRRIPSRLRIYECMDNDVALARSDAQRHTLTLLEAEICRASDLVICCTEELCAPRRAYNPSTFEVNCGADIGFFSQACADHTVVPDDIARLAKPVVGYMGGLDPWKIDVELLTSIARLRPEWSIALVGFVWFGFDLSVFEDYPNIHILGPKKYEALPSYLKGMDVCLMPFPLNDSTRYGDALKCYEYLAAGKPVVGRAVPVARRLSGLVRIADTAAEFVDGIEAALSEGQQDREHRQQAIGAHSWDQRTRQKLDLIKQKLRDPPVATGA